MKIMVKKELIDGILACSRDTHPREMILLLKGKVGNDLEVNEIVVPPSAVHGQGFSEFRPYMLPFDSSILGVVHSHPSGSSAPSVHDLNHPYGKITMIVAYPYRSVADIAIFGKGGQRLPFEIVRGEGQQNDSSAERSERC